MAEEAIRTIKVYEQDALRLTRMYGGPQWRAFRLALAKARCAHPEGERTYTRGLVPVMGEGLRQGEPSMPVSGFYCGACGSYIFPSVGAMLELEPA